MIVPDDHARVTYDAFAPVYDAFTAHHDYEAWTKDLEALAREHGLSGTDLLDVACGTGKSFIPFLDRGWSATACDISPEMVERATQKSRGRATLAVADMRSLPTFGSFDLVTCLDDGVNYLVCATDLARALDGMRRNLRPGGLLLFDTNTLQAYRSFFSDLSVVTTDGHVIIWTGSAGRDFAAGATATSEVEVLTRDHQGAWWRDRHRHVQRHFTASEIRLAIAEAGLEWVVSAGMQLDGSIAEGYDELTNSKAVHLARAPGPIM